MTAISLHPVWAGLIAAGEKTLEIRSWPTRHRGPLLICASLRPLCPGIKHGHALCIVNVVNCRPMRPEDERAAGCAYRPGLFAWELTDVRPLRPPVPVKGKQKLFQVAL